jgi:hypothetical protein
VAATSGSGGGAGSPCRRCACSCHRARHPARRDRLLAVAWAARASRAFPAWSLVATACGPRRSARCWPRCVRVARGGAVGPPWGWARPPRRAGCRGPATRCPGIVVALALVFFGAKRPPGVPDDGMLVFAYVVLFLPQAIGAMRSSLLQVTPSLEEASRLLGAGSFATFRRVVLPLTRPGVLGRRALVFLTCMKELPATLLLAPTGTARWPPVCGPRRTRRSSPARLRRRWHWCCCRRCRWRSSCDARIVRADSAARRRRPWAGGEVGADQPSGNAGADTAAEFTRRADPGERRSAGAAAAQARAVVEFDHADVIVSVVLELHGRRAAAFDGADPLD